MKVLAFACLLAVGKGAFLTVFPRKNDALVWRSGEFVLALRSDYTETSGKYFMLRLHLARAFRAEKLQK
jgi:hypothetical protein